MNKDNIVICIDDSKSNHLIQSNKYVITEVDNDFGYVEVNEINNFNYNLKGIFYLPERFISLEEYRKNKINSIINE